MTLHTQKGMTLPELIMAIAFSLFLTLGVFSFNYFMGHARNEYQSSIELTNDARKIIEKLVWGQKVTGVANRRGIAEAVSGNIISASQFSYLDVNNVTHTIRVNSGNIEYQRGAGGAWMTLLDPNGSSVVYDATKYTTSLVFTQPATVNSVLLKVIIGKKLSGRWYYGSASTQVFFRNA